MKEELKKLLDKCKKYRWCHNRMYKYYSNRNKIFTIPPILFASASSFLILDEEDDQKVIRYLSSSFAMLSAMFSGISMHLGYHAKADCHLMSANSYDELITKLYFMLNLKPAPSPERLEIFIEQTEEYILKIKSVNKYQIALWAYKERVKYKKKKDENKEEKKEDENKEEKKEENIKININNGTEL